MKCPLCGSDIAAGSKYCPICGADVEAAAQRARQAAQTQAMPRPQQPQHSAPRPQAQPQQYRAVPMNSSMPQQQPQNLRSIDTSKMGGTPKWPIVLIVVLALVIVVALVLIFLKPWQSSQPETRQIPSSAVSSTADATAATDATAQTTETTAEPAAAPAQPSTLGDEDAYAQLTASYDQLDGFHQQISALAEDFSNTIGSGDMTPIRDRAVELQGQIQAASDALAALAISDDSAYASTKAAVANLYNDLVMRVSVLAEASDDAVNGVDYSEILGRDNVEADEHGHTNKYLIDYEQNYEAARPAQLG